MNFTLSLMRREELPLLIGINICSARKHWNDLKRAKQSKYKWFREKWNRINRLYEWTIVKKTFFNDADVEWWTVLGGIFQLFIDSMQTDFVCGGATWLNNNSNWCLKLIKLNELNFSNRWNKFSVCSSVRAADAQPFCLSFVRCFFFVFAKLLLA